MADLDLAGVPCFSQAHRSKRLRASLDTLAINHYRALLLVLVHHER